jgi:hypothetical protein
MPRLITMRRPDIRSAISSSDNRVPYSAKVRIGRSCRTAPRRRCAGRRGGLLDGDHRVHQRAALAAVGLGMVMPISPAAHQLGDVEREARLVRALERVLSQMRLRELRTRRRTASALR